MENTAEKIRKHCNWEIVQCVLIIVFLVLIFRADPVKNTLAISYDKELSAKNKFEAGELDLSLSSSVDFSPEVTPDNLAEAEIKVKNENDPGFDFQAEAKNFSGDLCDKLNLKADQKGDGTFEYDDDLEKFKLAVKNFTEEELWKFKVNLQDSDLENVGKKCEFEIIFTASQIENNPPDGKGFSDTEKVKFTVESGEWSEGG